MFEFPGLGYGLGFGRTPRWTIFYSCNGMRRQVIIKAYSKDDAINFAKAKLRRGGIKINKVTKVGW